MSDELTGIQFSKDSKSGPSIQLPDPETAPFLWEQLYNIAILRLFGPFPMSYITEYLNKRYKRNWTGDQVVRAWRKLRHQQEIEKIVHQGQALYVSKEQYAAIKSDTSEAENFESIKENICGNFVAIMESDLDDSEFFVDVHLDNKAADGVTVLSSEPGKLGAILRGEIKPDPKDASLFEDTMFTHWKRGNDTNDNIAEVSERGAKAKALKDDLREWEEKVAKGDKNPGPRPAKWSSATGFNPKYHYKPKGPQKGDPSSFSGYNTELI
ncbi:MAG: hypothetical protein LQ337_005673 [Flavoplaca oasis]|nr:MAG: hypothetical protein LQ337_005673 [Flavoplaca oasis]